MALSGRRIAGVRRIWADGKLLRGSAGDFKTETKFRVHAGDEAQGRDPTIAAAEGLADTPAFRGVAYAVFEDFQLAEYGNRVPSLTFEVVADAGGTSLGAIAGAISSGAIVADAGTALTGFAAYGEDVRGVVAVLGEAVSARLFDDGAALRLGAAGGEVLTLVDGTDAERRRVAGALVPDAVTIGYYDPSRDYQAGSQRATHGVGGSERRIDAVQPPAAIDAGAAKALAAAKLDAHWRGRERRAVTLPWRAIGVRPGQLVRFADDGEAKRVWLVTEATCERMAVRLELVGHGGAAAATLPAVAGRAAAANDEPHGATTIRLFDAPPLGDTAEAGPRLLIAAAGAEKGWRSALMEASSDGGASWTPLGATAPAAVMGVAVGVLEPGGATLFDEHNAVVVELLSDEMWLESRDDDALVAGANAAMIGAELVQFGRAEPAGGRRFRLSRLLRGRRGSEWAAAEHAAGEAFVLVEPESLVALPLSVASIGGAAEVAARGIGDGDVPAVAACTIGTEAVRPPTPVHLIVEPNAEGDIAVRWTRRSRAGWAWIDGVDAPLGEPAEAYRLTIAGGVQVRVIEVDAPSFVYTRDAQAADGVAAGATLAIEVVQIGGIAASRAARIEFKKEQG